VAFKDFEFGQGSAVGVIIMLINLILALIYLSIGRRRSKAEREAAAS
jgi:multiple sugar transport system permease protein